MQRFKASAVALLKLAIAFSLIYWLVAEGKLQFDGLAIYWRSPLVAVMVVGFWLVSGVGFCGLRWRALLQVLGFRVSRREAIRLNLIGLFFNTVMPGAVGGDVLKVYYLCRGQAGTSKARVLLSVLLDRAIGLFALLLIATVSAMVDWSELSGHESLRHIAVGLFGIFGVSVVSIFGVWYPKFRLLELAQKVPFLGEISTLISTFRAQPLAFVGPLLLAIVHQMLSMLVFITVTMQMLTTAVPISKLLVILPLGIITTALPLAPSGLGVGHVAFEKLFALIGASNGANIFNVFLLGQLFLNLLGIFPYLLKKGDIPAQTEDPGLQRIPQSTTRP